MKAFDIRIQFPLAKPTDSTDGTDVHPNVQVLRAVYLPGNDPQFEAVQHVASIMGTRGLTITVQESQS